MKNLPKISICIPCFNRPDLTISALESAVNQTVKPFEILVVDDRSTDDMSTVKEFCRKHEITFLDNKKSLGLMGNVNETILKSSGDYYVPLHNDDILSPRFVEECQKFLIKYPDYNIWVTNGCGINNSMKVIGEFRLFNYDTEIPKIKGIRSMYRNGYYTLLSIIGSTVYRSSFIKKHLFEKKWGNEADLNAALEFLSTQDIMYVDAPIYFTRIHSSQQSNELKKTDQKLRLYINNRLAIYRKFSNKFGMDNELLYPVISVHLLQLLIKYHYSLKETIRILGLDCYSKVQLIKEMLKFIALQIIQKIKFNIYKYNITKFL